MQINELTESVTTKKPVITVAIAAALGVSFPKSTIKIRKKLTIKAAMLKKLLKRLNNETAKKVGDWPTPINSELYWNTVLKAYCIDSKYPVNNRPASKA